MKGDNEHRFSCYNRVTLILLHFLGETNGL